VTTKSLFAQAQADAFALKDHGAVCAIVVAVDGGSNSIIIGAWCPDQEVVVELLERCLASMKGGCAVVFDKRTGDV
jgi:hypothetical protein